MICPRLAGSSNVNFLSSYLLFYLKYVIKFNYGSYAMLSGQVADALATPAVGIWSDQTRTKIGKRIPWYIGGYFVIVISFLPVWNGNLLLDWLNMKDSQTVLVTIQFTLIDRLLCRFPRSF